MTRSTRSLYNDRDPRGIPAYGIAEAARYLRIPPATLRSWTRGRTYPIQAGKGSFEPLIRPADPRQGRLSFLNLTEAHVLRALRSEHGVPIRAVRQALAYAEEELGITKLLLSPELLTNGGEIFIERYGTLINLSRSGQIALKRVLQDHLRRTDRDTSQVPIRLFPFLREGVHVERSILIDPSISFGQPVLVESGVRTASVVARIGSGEAVEDVAADYGIGVALLEEALIFERIA